MQQTDFEVEILIGDDKSTDKNREIIKRYADKYPNSIKPILREKNIGVVPNFVNLMKRAKGEYIALCEGDDYWTNEHKLQRQIDFLESHPDHSVCFHPVKQLDEATGRSVIYPKLKKDSRFDLNELLVRNFIPTCSAVYRRHKYDDVPLDILPLDWYLHLLHAREGKIGFLDTVMAVYRRHSGSLWWESDKNRKKFWLGHGSAHLNFYGALMKMFAGDDGPRKIIGNNAVSALNEIRQLDKDLYAESVLKHPDFAGLLAESLADQLDRLDKHAQGQEERINQLQIEADQLKNEAELLRSALSKTVSHRLRKQVKRIIKKA